MKVVELAEIYAEVDDFLRDELVKFLHYLMSLGDLDLVDLGYEDWDRLIESYLEGKR